MKPNEINCFLPVFHGKERERGLSRRLEKR
jgi:hypothetical protein